MELSVCIFDTDRNSAERLQKYVAAVLFNADYRSKVISCCNDEAARTVTMKYPYVDLLFLPASASGLRFGEELRKTNRSTTIVYISDNDSNIYRAFRSLPIAYLTEYKNKNALSETILRAASWALSGKKFFCHESRQQLLQLRYEEINYFESRCRIVEIHKTDGSCEIINAKLDEVEAILPAAHFCRCHKSYLVNMENIDYVDKKNKDVFFRSGAKAPASKALYPILIAALKGDAICESVL